MEGVSVPVEVLLPAETNRLLTGCRCGVEPGMTRKQLKANGAQGDDL